ncbi:hypothetical protein DXG01_009594 [Tephrocybe rancida]|nr:hypothetical protein DXG01_009594 [Tephrocybe rancida]
MWRLASTVSRGDNSLGNEDDDLPLSVFVRLCDSVLHTPSRAHCPIADSVTIRTEARGRYHTSPSSDTSTSSSLFTSESTSTANTSPPLTPSPDGHPYPWPALSSPPSRRARPTAIEVGGFRRKGALVKSRGSDCGRGEEIVSLGDVGGGGSGFESRRREKKSGKERESRRDREEVYEEEVEPEPGLSNDGDHPDGEDTAVASVISFHENASVVKEEQGVGARKLCTAGGESMVSIGDEEVPTPCVVDASIPAPEPKSSSARPPPRPPPPPPPTACALARTPPTASTAPSYPRVTPADLIQANAALRASPPPGSPGSSAPLALPKSATPRPMFSFAELLQARTAMRARTEATPPQATSEPTAPQAPSSIPSPATTDPSSTPTPPLPPVLSAGPIPSDRPCPLVVPSSASSSSAQLIFTTITPILRRMRGSFASASPAPPPYVSKSSTPRFIGKLRKTGRLLDGLWKPETKADKEEGKVKMKMGVLRLEMEKAAKLKGASRNLELLMPKSVSAKLHLRKI